MGKIITSIGTVASIIGLAFTGTVNPWVTWGIVSLGVMCLAVLVFGDIRDQVKNERVCMNEVDIKQAMKELIWTTGKVCMMRRDLSWVDTEIAANIIERKDNVLIFAEQETPVTKELKDKGVNIKYYGYLGFEPKTRFTVIRYNRENPQVAIASSQSSVRKKNQIQHMIYQTSNNACSKISG